MDIDKMYAAYEWVRMLNWNEQVAGLTEQARASLAVTIAKIRQDLIKIIEDTDDLAYKEKENVRYLLDAIDDKISESCESISDMITVASVGTVTATISEMNSILSANGSAKNVHLFEGLSENQVTAIFKEQPLGGKKLFEWVEQSFENKVQQEIRIALNDGIEHGRSTRKIVNDMMSKIDVGIEGAKKEMTTLARTYIQAANTGAHELCYQENSDIIKGYKRVGALDNRTCLTCALLDGKKYYGAQKRPKLPQHPR